MAAETFAANLRHMMLKRGMTGGDLADAMAVSRQSVSQWRAGSVPKDKKRLAEVLGVSVEWLLQPHPVAECPVATDVEIRRLEPVLADAYPPRLAEITPPKLGLGLPAAIYAEIFGRHRPEDIAAVQVADTSMEPDLFLDDWVFTDLTARACTTSGIYLCVMHATAVWWRCVPIVKEMVVISNRYVTREVHASDLTIIGHGLRVFTRHIRWPT